MPSFSVLPRSSLPSSPSSLSCPPLSSVSCGSLSPRPSVRRPVSRVPPCLPAAPVPGRSVPASPGTRRAAAVRSVLAARRASAVGSCQRPIHPAPKFGVAAAGETLRSLWDRQSSGGRLAHRDWIRGPAKCPARVCAEINITSPLGSCGSGEDVAHASSAEGVAVAGRLDTLVVRSRRSELDPPVGVQRCQVKMGLDTNTYVHQHYRMVFRMVL